MKLKEVMKSVRTISPDETIKTAAGIMSKYGIGSLVAINQNKKVVGIVTESDIIKNVSAKDKLASRVRVEDIMSRNVITIDSNSLLDDAVYLMVKHKIKKLPIIENNELVGIVTSTDIVANSSDVGEFYLFS
jgi:CBS domain-containing protein